MNITEQQKIDLLKIIALSIGELIDLQTKLSTTQRFFNMVNDDDFSTFQKSFITQCLNVFENLNDKRG